MSAIKSFARISPQIRSAVQARQMSVVSTKPLVRIAFSEKLAHGIVMALAYSAIPVYVLVNLRRYRGLDDK